MKKWSNTSLKTRLGLDSSVSLRTVPREPFCLWCPLFTLLTTRESVLGLHQPPLCFFMKSPFGISHPLTSIPAFLHVGKKTPLVTQPFSYSVFSVSLKWGQILIYMASWTVCFLPKVFNFTLKLTLAYSVTLYPNFSVYFLYCIWSAYKSRLGSALSLTWIIFVFSLCNTILQQCQFIFFGSLDFLFSFLFQSPIEFQASLLVLVVITALRH